MTALPKLKCGDAACEEEIPPGGFLGTGLCASCWREFEGV